MDGASSGNAPMGAMEAVKAVCIYLRRCQVVFTFYRAWQEAETWFRVAIQQIQPENKERVFDVKPDPEIPEVWNMTEVL